MQEIWMRITNEDQRFDVKIPLFSSISNLYKRYCRNAWAMMGAFMLLKERVNREKKENDAFLYNSYEYNGKGKRYASLFPSRWKG